MSDPKLDPAAQAAAEAKAKADAEAKAKADAEAQAKADAEAQANAAAEAQAKVGARAAARPNPKKPTGAYRVLVGTIVAAGKSVAADSEQPFVDLPNDEADKLVAEGVIERA